MSECNCSYHNDICNACRESEKEIHQELTSLRAWKEKARPLLKEYQDDNYKYYNEIAKASRDRLLTELLKEGE